MPSNRYGVAAGAVSSVATRIGRRGRSRSATVTPAIMPTASPASTADHAGAPPSDCFATTGPSTPCAAWTAITSTENWATTTHNHCRDANSRQPSRRSWSTECDASGRAADGLRRPVVIVAAPANIAALTASAQPPPSNTTAAPLATSPVTRATLVPKPSTALPVCSRSAGTTSGMIPVIAGNSVAEAMPLIAAAIISAHTGAQPVINIAAAAANATVLPASPATITFQRGSRSAITPPTSRNATSGRASAASTTESVVGVACGNPRTPNASATGANAAPSVETVRVASRSANRRSRSSVRSPRIPAATPATLRGGRYGCDVALLAQVNVARMRGALDSAEMSGFVAALDPVYRL